MSNASEHRRQKSAEKAKKRRADAQRGRQAQAERGAVLGPLLPTYASQNWAEPGAVVQLAIARSDHRGLLVCAAIACDTGTGRLEAQLQQNVLRAGWDSFASRKAGELAMVVLEPAQIARILKRTADYGEQNGLPLPPDWPAVMRLLEGVNSDDAPFEVEVGPADLPPPAPTGNGILSRLGEWIFGGFSRKSAP
jgi:hypothetical protein